VKDEGAGIVNSWAVLFNRDEDRVKFKVGDTVTLTGAPNRNGAPRLILIDVNTITVGEVDPGKR
jgi:hypothetical protein